MVIGDEVCTRLGIYWSVRSCRRFLRAKGTTEDQKYFFFRHIHPTLKTKFHQSGILGEGGGGERKKGTSIVRDFFVLSFRRVAARTESIDADCPRSPANIKGRSLVHTFPNFSFLSFFKVITLSLSLSLFLICQFFTFFLKKKETAHLFIFALGRCSVPPLLLCIDPILIPIISPLPLSLPLPSCQLCCTVNPLFSTLLLDTSFTLTHLLHSSHFITTTHHT